jgi:hypothetical protein
MKKPVLLAVVLLLSGCSLGNAGPSDGSPPFITITAPAAGASVSGSVAIDATVFDDIGVDEVRFLIDGTEIARIFTAPFRTVWNTQAVQDNSPHTIRIEAFDVARNRGVKEIIVTVVNNPI